STNGRDWHKQISGVSGLLRNVAFGNNRFVAVRLTATWDFASSNVLVSADGATWSTVDGLLPRDIAFGGGFFLIPDARGSILNVSSDGYNWTQYPIQTNSPSLYSVTFNNGTFVSAGRFGRIVQSDPILSLGISFDGKAHLSIEGPKNQTYRIEANDSGP